MLGTWVVLIPPILVLLLTFFTKKVIHSLIAGIVVSSLIIQRFAPWQALAFIATQFKEQLLEPANLFTFGFILILGTIISLVSLTGGARAYGTLLKKRIHTKKGAEKATIGLALCLGFDDFFGSLTVGTIMRPLTDVFHIARAKLAFLVDSLAAPVVILVPISTWIAMLLMQLTKAGISLDISENPLVLADPFSFYLTTIPYVFYSFITIFSVITIVLRPLSFGPMKYHEDIARETGNLFGNKPPIQTTDVSLKSPSDSLFDFIIPIGSLFICCFLSILYFGNYYLFGGTLSLWEAFQESEIFKALFVGGLISLCISCIAALIRKKIVLSDMRILSRESYGMMRDSIIILLLSWTFGTILRDNLQAGTYLAQTFLYSMPISIMPVMFFIVSLITSLATGSSWGTIAVLLPLGVPMFVSLIQANTPIDPEQYPILYQIVGAIFSGAVVGDHISPISSTTVMAATSSGSYLDDHISTQMVYAVPALVGTTVSYLISAYLNPFNFFETALISVSIGIVTTGVLLFVGNRMFRTNKAKA